MPDVLERFATMERCRECLTVLPDPPAPRVCTKCGAVKVTPRHSEWPHSLKAFLIIRFAVRHLFPEFRSMQSSWELLLVGNYQGRQVNGQIMRHSLPPDDVYAMAVKDAEEWRLAGGKAEFL